jgi:tetratricopeptide (TPR) repeat protein
MKKRRVARQGLLRGQELLTKGAYKESLRENQEVYSMVGENAPGDEAIFTMGLIYAHYKNPEKDYKKAISFFKKLIEDYPRSTLVEQARIWVGTLDAIEKEKQVDSEKGQKKREVKGQEQSARKLFNEGLNYANNENPEKNYKAAIDSFNNIITNYPQSTLVKQAKIWVGTLDIIEQEKQVDIEIEQKKKKLERQIVEREEVSPNGDPTQTDSKQGGTPAAADRVSQEDSAPSRKKDAHITVLEDEGGSLYFLALNHYQKTNATLWDLILQANPSITDFRQINDHQEIIVPVINAESYIKKISDEDYRVYIGTFTTRAIAAAYSQKVGSAEKPFSIDSREFSSQDRWYRLTMDDFKDKEEALKIVSLLEEKGLIYIPPELDMMGEEKQVDNEKAEKNRELKKQE